MIGESLAILAVFVVLAAMLARSGRHALSAFVLPLCGIPLFHLLGRILRVENLLLPDAMGLLASLLACLLFSRAFSLRRNRVVYLLFCCVFLLVLMAAYAWNLR